MIIDKQKEAVLAIKDSGGCTSVVALELWTRYSIEEGNSGDLEALRIDPYVGPARGGFNWGNTPQDGSFWSSVLFGGRPYLLDSITDEVMDYIDFQHFN